MISLYAPENGSTYKKNLKKTELVVNYSIGTMVFLSLV